MLGWEQVTQAVGNKHGHNNDWTSVDNVWTPVDIYDNNSKNCIIHRVLVSTWIKFNSMFVWMDVALGIIISQHVNESEIHIQLT